MHKRKESAIDHTYRLRCLECDAERFAELGGETEERARADEEIEVTCGRCSRIQPHVKLAP